MIIKLTNENFKQETSSSQKTLVDFWAPWCGPCKMLAPILDEIDSEMPEVRIGKVNVDEQLEIAREYGIAAIPTLLLFENGEVIKKSVGLLSKDEILELLK